MSAMHRQPVSRMAAQADGTGRVAPWHHGACAKVQGPRPYSEQRRTAARRRPPRLHVSHVYSYGQARRHVHTMVGVRVGASQPFNFKLRKGGRMCTL